MKIKIEFEMSDFKIREVIDSLEEAKKNHEKFTGCLEPTRCEEVSNIESMIYLLKQGLEAEPKIVKIDPNYFG